MEKKEDLLSTSNQSGVASREYEDRVAKVDAMKKAGIEPWPSKFNLPSETCASLKSLFDLEGETPKKYSVAGRLILLREHGKTIFADLQDRSGKIQLYIKKDILGEDAFDKFKKFIDLGDIVWCEGSVFKTKMGEITLRVEKMDLLSKCLHPLPEKYHGLTDLEQRYRQRYLDLISNPESREKFKRRPKIIQSIRQFFLDMNFLEVETPMFHTIPGGAAAKPFITHHNAYDMDLFLRIAPELYLKRLVIGGFERVFEINRSFRNEGVSTKHNPEFTMLEFYMAYSNYKNGMGLVEKLLQRVVHEVFNVYKISFGDVELNFEAPFKKLTLEKSLIEVGGLKANQINKDNIDSTLKERGIDLASGDESYGEKLFLLFDEFVEKKLIQPTFITKYPVEVSPLAKRDDENPYTTARFELFLGGMELANGFSELNDPFDQASRFKKKMKESESESEGAHHYDADFIRALEYGLPPTVGVGIGIDRLVMFLTNTTSIKDVILFPTMKLVGR